MLGDLAYKITTRLGIKDALKNLFPSRLVNAMRPALSHEILALETQKSDWNIEALKNCPEVLESSWRGLGSLAYQIVRTYKPANVVELGTHMGFSALCIALALRDNNDGGKIYAIDTWEGDAHTGAYGSTVYAKFMERRTQLGLESTIVPLRMTFAQARSKVPPAIDLLHIDGLHTWDAVNQDFTMYSPLVRKGGLILFHDVNTHFKDVRRFWRRICRRHEHYTVPYSHGLGIMRV